MSLMLSSLISIDLSDILTSELSSIVKFMLAGKSAKARKSDVVMRHFRSFVFKRSVGQMSDSPF